MFRPDPALTFGASYQFETSLGNMKTGGGDASLSACITAVPSARQPLAADRSVQALTCDGGGLFQDAGRITVIDFQWPAMLAVGVAWQATPTVLLAADLKRLQWSDVMKDFRLRYDSAGIGGSVSFALPQDWKDQTVTSLGVAWSATPALVLRAGLNLASNPIPDTLVHPLFPATVERHYTAGLGYRLSPASEFNGSLTVAPTTRVTNGMGVVVEHSQTNVQLMYSHRF